MMSTNREMIPISRPEYIENMNNPGLNMNSQALENIPNTNENTAAQQQQVEDNRTFREKHPGCYGTYSVCLPRFGGVWTCDFSCDTKVIDGCIGLYIFWLFLSAILWFLFIYVCFALFVIKFWCFLFSLCCGWEFYWAGSSNSNVNVNTVKVENRNEVNNNNNNNINIENKTDFEGLAKLITVLNKSREPKVEQQPPQYNQHIQPQYQYAAYQNGAMPPQAYPSNMNYQTQGMINPQMIPVGSNGPINVPVMGQSYVPANNAQASQMMALNNNMTPNTQTVPNNQLPTIEQVNSQSNLMPPNTNTVAPTVDAALPGDSYLEPVEQQKQVNPELYVSKPV